jgi:hypothetical protein
MTTQADSRFIFISYARKDGQELAQQLQRDLNAAGYQVWLDTSQIGGGTSWSRDIENAIERCNTALLLLSEGSYVSEICRAEQILCLDKKKQVIPLLVQPNAQRPLHLYSLNYRDFSAPAQYQVMFSRLLQDITLELTQASPPRHTVNTAPPLPTNFVPRAKELQKLRQMVIGDASDQRSATIALQGMGGIGKSVIAAALCHDDVIQAAFPDGILWITIGRETGSLVEQMQEIGRGIGDLAGHYTSEQAGMNRLRTVLPTKSVLLVLDDVWDVHHVEPFITDAPRCRLLFTARDRGIALALGASEIRVGKLNQGQAVDLLREWSEREDPALPEIAKRLGNLPLALKLAGARLREGMDGAQWAVPDGSVGNSEFPVKGLLHTYAAPPLFGKLQLYQRGYAGIFSPEFRV